MEKTFAKVSKK